MLPIQNMLSPPTSCFVFSHWLAREQMQSKAFTSALSPPVEALTLRRNRSDSGCFASLVSLPSQQRRRLPRLCSNVVLASYESRRWISGSVERSEGWKGGRYGRFEVSAASEEVGEVEIEKAASGVIRMLELGVLFALWIIFNIYFNIYNKQVLKVFPFPLTLSALQFLCGTILVVLMWTFNLYKRPKIRRDQLAAIFPLAVVHTLGNLFTMSLGQVSVSFTHTIKAMEPFFSVVLSAMFLGETPTLWVVSSLVPVVGGVVLASLTEASFNWIGFMSAMASNLANQSRNVLSKKLMVKKEDAMDNITLFSIITIMSFILLAPVAVVMEGVKFTPSYLQSAGLNVKEVLVRSLLAALCFHAYQQVAYMILQRVSPVTHSVANCVKRVVVIVSSVLVFRTPVSPINSLGTGIAIAGVFLYSRVEKIKPKSS